MDGICPYTGKGLVGLLECQHPPLCSIGLCVALEKVIMVDRPVVKANVMMVEGRSCLLYRASRMAFFVFFVQINQRHCIFLQYINLNKRILYISSDCVFTNSYVTQSLCSHVVRPLDRGNIVVEDSDWAF